MTDSSDLYFFYPSNVQPIVLYSMLLDLVQLNECGTVYMMKGKCVGSTVLAVYQTHASHGHFFSYILCTNGSAAVSQKYFPCFCKPLSATKN